MYFRTSLPYQGAEIKGNIFAKHAKTLDNIVSYMLYVNYDIYN